MGEKLKKVDWLGTLFFTTSITLTLIAISWGGVQYAWASSGTLAPLCVGTLGLIWTLIYDDWHAGNPYKNYRYPIWIGWGLTTVGSGLTILWDVNTTTSLWAPPLSS
ncbi:hypothetical protein B0I35DRAFT_485423 [Stachybotrys elegans]|uniref:Uncharacterized protein n=1 Tax=Stachybotrys elegans TaxID=80388 RepID=A0A8K0SFE5_9HYPO|nr:hypothetical protein B0I35DRAFT_485423 [Stachybotrys elegans]